MDTGNHAGGLSQIIHQNVQKAYAVEAKATVTRITVAILQAQAQNHTDRTIIITEYITSPMAEVLRNLDLFFLDAAGNAYLNDPPLYIFIKGNKLPVKSQAVHRKRLFKPAGLKVLFALPDN